MASRRPACTPPAISAPILGTDFACDLIVYRGAGSYVCGEASGAYHLDRRQAGYPRNRPPRLTVRGLYQRPTVDQQRGDARQHRRHRRHGGEAFSKVGTAKNPGTRLISISGHVQQARRVRSRGRLSVGEIHPRGLRRHAQRPGLKCVIPGGISTKVLTARRDRAAAPRPRQRDRGGRLVARLGRNDRRSPRAPAWSACCR